MPRRHRTGTAGHIPIFAYCLMPNHWHLVVRPESDGDLSRFMHDVAGTHAQRWNVAQNVPGQGAVYQGRFKSVPVQNGPYFLKVCRYVERNPARATLVPRSRDWKWSSLWRRLNGYDRGFLDEWPIARPEPWETFVDDDPRLESDLDAIRSAVRGSVPYGADAWRENTAARLGLPSLERGRGRPKKTARGSAENLPTLF